jgi:hypothetical protein
MERVIRDRIAAWNERSSAETDRRICRICQMLSGMLNRIGIGGKQSELRSEGRTVPEQPAATFHHSGHNNVFPLSFSHSLRIGLRGYIDPR